MSDAPPPPNHGTGLPSSPAPRRVFVKLFTCLIGGAVGILPLLPGLRVLLDPLRKRSGPSGSASAGLDGMVRVTHVEAVPDDGVPRQFPVIADEHDAWNYTPQQRIGSVFLRRQPGSDQLQCFSNICPHAGCSVNFSAAQSVFVCPCHNSRFTPDGEMIHPTESPRSLDPLEVQTAEDGSVHIKYVRYFPAKAERIAKS